MTAVGHPFLHHRATSHCQLTPRAYWPPRICTVLCSIGTPYGHEPAKLNSTCTRPWCTVMGSKRAYDGDESCGTWKGASTALYPPSRYAWHKLFIVQALCQQRTGERKMTAPHRTSTYVTALTIDAGVKTTADMLPDQNVLRSAFSQNSFAHDGRPEMEHGKQQAKHEGENRCTIRRWSLSRLYQV